MDRQTARRWTMDDLMDFEYFLYREENSLDSDGARALFLREIKPVVDREPDRVNDRPFVFRLWLDARRKEDAGKQESVTPGMIFRQIRGFVAFLCVIAGFFTGTGLCFSFLSYQGREPLNVSSYLGLFLLTQILLLGAGLSMFVFWKLTKQDLPFSLIRFLLWNLMVKLMETVGRKTSNHLNRETLDRFKSAWGLARGRSRCYGRLFPYPLFIPTQVFAVCFNLGLLVATLLKVLGSDLAFGWQSTLQLGSNAVYTLVRFVSLPWSFFIHEPLAHPSLAQIEGTRMVLKDGITRLATQDLVSWWPFLCLCVVFYGLLPRIVFLVSAWIMEQKTIARIQFDTMPCDMLMMRLTHPLLETQGEIGKPDENKRGTVQPSPSFPSHNGFPGNVGPANDLSPFLALVPRDISDDCPDHELNHHLTHLFGTGFDTRLTVDGNARKDEDILKEHIHRPSNRRVVCLMEAWQPPIRETLAFVEKLRELGGESLRIHILLVGKPVTGTLFTAPSADDALAWKHAVNTLADINIRLSLIPEKPVSQNEEARP